MEHCGRNEKLINSYYFLLELLMESPIKAGSIKYIKIFLVGCQNSVFYWYLTVAVIIYNIFLKEISFSWYDADEICNSYNGTLLSFSSYNDVITVQALLMEVFGHIVNSHIHIGLRTYTKVSDLCELNLFVMLDEQIKKVPNLAF